MFLNIELTKSIVCFMKNGQPVGSGVILSFDGKAFICTCKHVVNALPDRIVVNNKFAKKNEFGIVIEYFKFHNNADIAITPLNTKNATQADSDIIMVNKDTVLYYGSSEFNNLSLGDTVFALGFPLGLSGKNRNYPILRGGFIARLDEECIEQNHCFLIDSNIFPGNSGGPVFLKPESQGIGETVPIRRGYLLGIVSGYIPYVDKLISEKTNQVVSTNREHSGLSIVVPIHYAKEIYDEHFSKAVPS